MLDEFYVWIEENMPDFLNMFVTDDDDPYGISVIGIASILLALHTAKDAGYGRSWAKRGESGVFHNVMRKKDRLEQLEKLAVEVMALDNMDCADKEDAKVDREAIEVSFIDTMVDLANYCMMWLSWTSRARPDAFMAWVKDIWCKATGTSSDVIEELMRNENEIATLRRCAPRDDELR